MAPAGKFQFVKKQNRSDDDAGGLGGNMASKFAGKALRSEMAKADGQLQSDFESILKGEAIYLPNFHCSKKDFSLLAGLAKDMEEHEAAVDGGGMINWSKHLKVRLETPTPEPVLTRKCGVFDSLRSTASTRVLSTALADPLAAIFLLKTENSHHLHTSSTTFPPFPSTPLNPKPSHPVLILQHENPDFSPTFKRIVEEMSTHFDVEVYATR